jgi:hypothetical protein
LKARLLKALSAADNPDLVLAAASGMYAAVHSIDTKVYLSLISRPAEHKPASHIILTLDIRHN